MSLSDWLTPQCLFAFTVIVIYLGEKIQQIFLTKILREALRNSQAPPTVVQTAPTAQATPAPPPAATPPPVPAPIPPPLPKPSGPFADAPPWFQGALHEIGFHETGNNGGIDRYIALAHTGANGDPWCSIFACAMVEQSGVRSPRSASSQSWRTDPNYVKLPGPALGAIVVFWRGSQSSGLGHVGFYRGEDSTRVWTLGGNENDMVQIEALPKSSGTFGLIGYWWPKSVPLPTTGPVIMPSGSAVSVQTDPTKGATPSTAGGVQSNITATMFSTQETANRMTAYGTPLDDNTPGVALPFHFPSPRPMVRVTSVKTGVSVDCVICDVGPWNINDPYWQSGSRPESESGTDNTGRHTNKAGIDLTIAAAQALQIDGKGLVNWQFIDNNVKVV